jgi:hypothetical protein
VRRVGSRPSQDLGRDLVPARDSALAEVTLAPARRRILFSGARGALRHRIEELRSDFLIKTTPASGQLTDTLLGDAPMAAFAGAFLGCLTTEWFNASGIAPDIGSALVTAVICGALLITRTTGLFAAAFFPALYGGAFAGMTPIVWLSGSATGALSVALSIVCGLVFFVVARLDSRSAAPIGTGCGGRLGAIAVVASFLFVELVRPLGADTSRFHGVATGALDVEPWAAVRALVASLVGIFGTVFVLRQRHVADGSVPARIFIASAAALLGLIVLHRGDPGDLSAIDAFYAGCFAGMSAPDRLKGRLQPIFAALVLIVLLPPVRAYLNGFGGSLGLAAFIAVMLIVASIRATAWMARDMLTGNKRFATAAASAVIACFLVLGSISVEPLTEEGPVSVDPTSSEQAAQAAESPIATPVRLVIGKPAPGAADSPIPIGISLVNPAVDDVVLLSGLPAGSTVTNGRPSATGGWHLLASELADAAIRPAQGFTGGADITVELRRADQSIVDHQERHLEWAGPAPPAKTDPAPPVAAGPSADQIPNAVTEDEEALFRAFLQSRGHAAPGIQGVALPVHTTARGPHARSPAAASAGHASAVPPAGAAVRPRQPLGWPADLTGRQKKPAARTASLPAPHRDRPAAVSP